MDKCSPVTKEGGLQFGTPLLALGLRTLTRAAARLADVLFLDNGARGAQYCSSVRGR
jgi:hypothetical protein